jgi:hypothetical protein
VESFLLETLRAVWTIVQESSVYLLFGAFVAGLIAVVMPQETVARHLGGRGYRGILKAALLGIPLPLCSCGVMPTALGLRRQGASRGSTLAFMIATPETGVDSIALTYALLDPIYTVFRPVAAFTTAIATGGLVTLLDKEEEALESEPQACVVCNSDKEGGHAHTRREKLLGAFRYGFGDLLDDLALWLVVGFLLAGLITALVPESFFRDWVGSGLGSMALMLVVAIPIYICATASTPIAAALIAKGLSPGAALVLLLAGPATNAATITMVARYLGLRTASVYLSSIAVVSVLMGLALNGLYGAWDIEASSIVMASRELVPSALKTAGALLLVVLLARSLIKRVLPAAGKVAKAER